MSHYFVNVWEREDGTRYATGIFMEAHQAKRNRNIHYLENDGVKFCHTDQISMQDDEE